MPMHYEITVLEDVDGMANETCQDIIMKLKEITGETFLCECDNPIFKEDLEALRDAFPGTAIIIKQVGGFDDIAKHYTIDKQGNINMFHPFDLLGLEHNHTL